jgi:hypothetical protein
LSHLHPRVTPPAVHVHLGIDSGRAANRRSWRAHFLDVLVSASSRDAFTPTIEEIKMMLENKTAAIYGGGGAIGSAVARAFATPARGSTSPGGRGPGSRR